MLITRCKDTTPRPARPSSPDGNAPPNRLSFTKETRSSTRWPQTPRPATPNSARKRQYTPSLSRRIASPGRNAKMLTLFEDAAMTLQYTVTPSRHPSSNIKRPRIPSSQARTTRFGHMHVANVQTAPNTASDRGDDQGGCTFKEARPEEGIHRQSSIHGCLTTPSRPQLTAEDRIIYESLTDHPTPSISKDPVGFMAALQASHDVAEDAHAQEPISSGFATPDNNATPYSKTPPEIKHLADINAWALPPSSPPMDAPKSEDEECHSTHGVRLIMPYTHVDAEEAQQANIDAWLENVLGASSERPSPVYQGEGEAPTSQEELLQLPNAALDDPPSNSDSEPIQEDRPPSRHSNNKENISPPKTYPLSIQPSLYTSSFRQSSRFRSSALPGPRPIDQNYSAIKFAHPLTPGGWLSAPPKRKKPRINDQADTPSKPEKSNPQDFTIHDDDLAAALAKLSPSVERHRKGHGPKRERCASYWDTDVLDPDSPAYPAQKQDQEAALGEGKVLRSGRHVLGESVQSEAITSEEPFTPEARATGFDFEA